VSGIALRLQSAFFLPTGNLPDQHAADSQCINPRALFVDAAQINDFQAPASLEHPMLEGVLLRRCCDDEFSYPNAHFRTSAARECCGFSMDTSNAKSHCRTQSTRDCLQNWSDDLRPEILRIPSQ
jgi:hypothetical protein